MKWLSVTVKSLSFPDLSQSGGLGQFHQAVVETGFKMAIFSNKSAFCMDQAEDITCLFHHSPEFILTVGHIAVGIFLVLIRRRIRRP